MHRDPFCPFHGRIRDMDAGASPFVDEDLAAFAASEMYESDYQRRLRREANEADARRETDEPMTREEFVEALAKEVPGLKFFNPEQETKLYDRFANDLADELNKSLDELDDGEFGPGVTPNQVSPQCRCTYTWQTGEAMKRQYVEDCPIHTS